MKVLSGIPEVRGAAKDFAFSSAGKVLLSYAQKEIAKQNSSLANIAQSGQAGAVPPPSSAPPTGGAHEDVSIEDATQPDLQYVNNRTATNFHQATNGTLAAIANNDMKGGHASTGDSYANDNR